MPYNEGQVNTTEQETLQHVTELTTAEERLECMLEIRKNRGTNLADPKEELMAAQQTLDMAEEKAKQNKELLSFYAIRNDSGEIVGTAKLNIYNKDGEKRAHLGRLTVKPEYRGKRLATALTNKTIETALANACETMDAEVDLLNPPALVSRLNDGFAIVDLNLELDEDGERCFSVIKRLRKEPGYDKKIGSLGEMQEICLTEAEKIQNLLRNGWVGIDTRNLEEKNDMDPKKWMLILEKVEESI
jgi:ribosomal protein S18 acetylase RimI-like enzyme